MEQRDTIRFLADLTVNCRVPASPTSGTISDISTSGCRLGIRSGVAIPGGTILLELLPGFHAIGQVIWKTEAEVGIHFEQRLDQTLVDHIRDGGEWRV